jgi:hypothetical protein
MAGNKRALWLGLSPLAPCGSLILPIRQGVAREATEQGSARRELAEIFKADQADRERFLQLSPNEIQEVVERDRKRRQLDRFLHRLGRPQRFGTQYQRKDGGPWTQEPFDRSLPDAVRKEFSVPPLVELEKKTAELNQQTPSR